MARTLQRDPATGKRLRDSATGKRLRNKSDGTAEACCCGTTPCDDDCCVCGNYYFHTTSLPTFDVRERVRNFNSAADCAGQVNCVFTTFNKYTDWTYYSDEIGNVCGYWKSTKISSFTTTPCEAMPAASDPRWGTPTGLDGGCEVRYNCETDEWEFRIPAQSAGWLSMGAGTNDGVSSTYDYGCIEVLDPVYERHDVDVTVSGAECTPCPQCPDCAETEISNVTLGGNGAIGSFPAWNSGSCTCNTNPNGYNAARTYLIRRIITDTIVPFCDNDTNFFDRELGPPAGWGGNTGSGANAVTITVNDGTNAIAGAVVHITQGGNEWMGTTDAFGQVIFALNNNTYNIDIYKPGYNFTPTTFTVSGAGSFTFSMTYDGTTGIISLQWQYENLDYREYLIMPPYLDKLSPPVCCWKGQAEIWYAQCYGKRMVDGGGNPYKPVSGNVVEPGVEWFVDCCYCVNNYDVELCFEFFDSHGNPVTVGATTYTASLTTSAVTTNCPGAGSLSINQTWSDQPMPIVTPWTKTGLSFTVTDSDGTGYTLAMDLTLCPEGV